MKPFAAFLLALAAGVATSSPARAADSPFRSPEERIAYLLFGVMDGADARLDVGPGRRWRRASSSPAVLKVGGRVLAVRRTGACAFSLEQRTPDGVQTGRVDLGRISGWRPEGHDSVIEGDGVCLSGAYPCPLRRYAFQVPDISDRLHREAYEALRAEACPAGQR